MTAARALVLAPTLPQGIEIDDVVLDCLADAGLSAGALRHSLYIVPLLADPEALAVLGRVAGTPAFGERHIVCLRGDIGAGGIPGGVARRATWLPTDLPDGMIRKILASIARGTFPDIDECGGALPGTFSVRFALKTLDDVTRCMRVVTRLCAMPPEMAIGLQELLVNAIEHGNLEISFEEKSRLLEGGLWHEEITRRIRDAVYAARVAIADLWCDGKETRIRVRDDGAGFDPTEYTSGSRRTRHPLHGRGISIARQAGFRALEYVGCGNEVVAVFDMPPRRAA